MKQTSTVMVRLVMMVSFFMVLPELKGVISGVVVHTVTYCFLDHGF